MVHVRRRSDSNSRVTKQLTGELQTKSCHQGNKYFPSRSFGTVDSNGMLLSVAGNPDINSGMIPLILNRNLKLNKCLVVRVPRLNNALVTHISLRLFSLPSICHAPMPLITTMTMYHGE